MTSHDAHFKQLLRTFFAEFLEAFVPEVTRDLDRKSIQFLDKELLRLRGGRKSARLVDLVAKVRFRGEPGFVLVHVEHQASRQREMAQRMFFYAAWLFEQTGLPIFPILLTSYDSPRTVEPDRFVLEVRGLRVFEFGFRVVQLNRLDWRDYLRRPNPAAMALMMKMRIAPRDRPKVRAQVLRMLVTMRLDTRKMDLIADFAGAYLRLTAKEYVAFQQELDQILDEGQKGKAMELISEWKREGRRLGRQEGRQEGQQAIVLRLLEKRLGPLPNTLREQIKALTVRDLEALAEALLDFTNMQNLTRWLGDQSRS